MPTLFTASQRRFASTIAELLYANPFLPERIEREREALGDDFEEASAATDGEVCFVAGADLAHLGPFFGDPEKIDAARLQVLGTAEKQRLAHLEQGDPARFHLSVEGNGNPDRVCGTTPITLTAALAGGQGQLLLYDQACAADGSQVVSFCSMAFAGALA